MIKNVKWRQPWKRTMAWVPAFIAQDRGFFTDMKISNPNIEPGFGSPDTARRVGTNKAAVGHADTGSMTAALGEGMDFSIVGASRQRTILALTWRNDRMDSPSDLEGKTVVLGTPFAEATWPAVPDVLGLDPDAITTNFASQGASVSQVSEGGADAVWMGANGGTAIHRQFEKKDSDVTTTPMNNWVDVAGYGFLVSNTWVEEESDSIEYLSRLLSGYSKALKWTVTHPDESLQLTYNEINPALKTNSDQVNEGHMAVNIAITLSEFIADGGGLLDFDDEMMQTAMDTFGNALMDDPDSVPAYDDVVDRRALDEAELATFSQDEWNKATEWAQPIWDWWK
jgi:NitT/TauT family transport system substrate-binding protein